MDLNRFPIAQILKLKEKWQRKSENLIGNVKGKMGELIFKSTETDDGSSDLQLDYAIWYTSR